MKKLFLLLLLIFSMNCIRANSITLTFGTPLANQVLDSDLVIKVYITSTFQLTSVVANIEGRQTNLIYDINDLVYQGYISLTGLQQGIPLQLTVTATDVFNTQQSAFINIIYAPPPKIHVSYPIDNSNIYPSFRVKANATSIDPNCRIKIFLDVYTSVAFDLLLNNPVDTVLTIPTPYPHSERYTVRISAVDTWNQVSTISVPVIFDNNIYLSEVFRADGAIYDLNYNKVLFASGATGKIVDIITHNETTMTGTNFARITEGILTPYGAIYYNKTPYTNDSIYEWNNNVVYTLARTSELAIVHTSGKWATFWGSGGLTRRNLATHTNDWVETYLPDERPDINNVDSSGTVVYKSVDSLFRYRNNQLSPLSNGSGYYSSYYPTIDRDYTAFLKRNGDAYTSINMHDGTTEFLLSDFGEFGPAWPFSEKEMPYYYQTKNRYVAYVKKGTAGEFQVWLRDSSGTSSQRTFFNTGSSIELLNSNGDIMYYHYDDDGSFFSHRYLAKRGPLQLPVSYGSAAGKLYYSDTSWYVVQGNIVYKLLIDAYKTVSNGNWNDPATWLNGIVPPPNANVIILNNVIVNVNATCNTLNIHAPGTITVAPGINLIILH